MNFKQCLAGIVLGLTLGCSSPESSPPKEQCIAYPSRTTIQRCMAATGMICKVSVYQATTEVQGKDKKWYSTEVAEVKHTRKWGSCVALAKEPGQVYLLTANHVVTTPDVFTEINEETPSVREVYHKIKEHMQLVEEYKKEGDEFLIKGSLLEVVASSEQDLALVRAKENSVINTIRKLGNVYEGDLIFGTSMSFADGVKGLSARFNQRIIRSCDIGSVKARDDPQDSSDDHITYVTMNTQKGNSGGPVFDTGGSLIGIRILSFPTGADRITGMVHGDAIREFLQKSGYARFIQ